MHRIMKYNPRWVPVQEISQIHWGLYEQAHSDVFHFINGCIFSSNIPIANQITPNKCISFPRKIANLNFNKAEDSFFIPPIKCVFESIFSANFAWDKAAKTIIILFQSDLISKFDHSLLDNWGKANTQIMPLVA